MADWEKVYENTLTGKSIEEIGSSKEFVLVGSSHEPTVAKLLKIKVWKDPLGKEIPSTR